MEVGDSSSNCLPGVVTREGVMALVKLGVRDEGPVYSQFIVSKYKRRAINWKSQAPQGEAQIYDLLRAGASTDMLRTEGGRFHICL